MEGEFEETKSLLKIGIELQLKKIFANGHFDVCAMGEILKAMGGDGEVPTDVHLFHCVDYKSMGIDTKAMLFKRCIELMAEACSWGQFMEQACEEIGLNDHQKTITIQLEHPAGFFKRLIGKG